MYEVWWGLSIPAHRAWVQRNLWRIAQYITHRAFKDDFSVQEQLTSPITRIQELESLNQDKARQQADLQLQLEGIQEQLAVANAHIQEVESLNQAQALQHADVQFQLEGNVESLKSQLKRAKQYYGKWAKDQVNQAFDLAESSGMMKPGEKFKRYWWWYLTYSWIPLWFLIEILVQSTVFLLTAIHNRTQMLGMLAGIER